MGRGDSGTGEKRNGGQHACEAGNHVHVHVKREGLVRGGGGDDRTTLLWTPPPPLRSMPCRAMHRHGVTQAAPPFFETSHAHANACKDGNVLAHAACLLGLSGRWRPSPCQRQSCQIVGSCRRCPGSCCTSGGADGGVDEHNRSPKACVSKMEGSGWGGGRAQQSGHGNTLLTWGVIFCGCGAVLSSAIDQRQASPGRRGTQKSWPWQTECRQPTPK